MIRNTNRRRPEGKPSPPQARRSVAGAALLAALLLTAIVAAVGGGTPAAAVVGGVEASPSIYPAVVQLEMGGEACDGTIIAPDTILTAAHCVDGLRPDQVSARGNSISHRPMTAITRHPLWNGDLADGHDLAILRTQAGATVPGVKVQVGAPWQSGLYAANQPATIVGHGRTSADVPATGVLHAVDTVVRSDGDMDDLFNPWYWFDYWRSSLMIGAGTYNHTACYGDSGGPLLVDKDNTWNWVQVGVTSFGWPFGCHVPAAFSELNGAQLAWVASLVPTIKAAWGPCQTATTANGVSYVDYSPDAYVSSQPDGSFWWRIGCYDPSPPVPPPTSPSTTRPCRTRNCQEQ